MALIGYARVSTEEQQIDPQLVALRAAGCGAIFEERASGGSRSRVELARCQERIGQRGHAGRGADRPPGPLLSHPIEVIEHLRAGGRISAASAIRSIPRSVQGIFTLQELGAAAELERALIRERTRAGLR
jgi:DNA invertase Pin-like site-specific DNA recombinase